jgi:hypothetical protein
MGNPITNEVARKALKKLNALDISEKGAAHPTFAIYHNGVIVATTGLRHSSKKDIALPHIKRDLRVNVRFVLDLARCTKYFDDWIAARGLESPPKE